MSSPRQGAGPHVTAQRAGRLCRLITLLGTGPHARDAVLRKLKIDLRGFYRDLELLRSRGVTVNVEGTRYTLNGDIDTALSKLPVPDPGLSVRDALVLARGNTDAHRRFRRRLDALLGERVGRPTENGPRVKTGTVVM